MMAVRGAPDCTFSSSALDDIQYGARSHIGRRGENQDDLYLPTMIAHTKNRMLLFAVADGMGGHPGAATASRMACEGLAAFHDRCLTENGRPNAPEICRHLVETIYRIALRIRLEGKKTPSLEDMGTTLSCLMLADRYSIVAHVGDSRIYRLRGDYLTHLTTDHTFVQDMIFEGEVAQEKAASHPLRHLLTRAVGTVEPLEWVDTRIDPRGPADRYLLCTDGLYNAINDRRLAALLASGAGASGAAIKLVDEALHNGARDNITAVVVIPSCDASRMDGKEWQRS